VVDERNAPDQILLGAMDTHYCVLIGLATWLEYWIENYNDITQTEFLFGIRGMRDPIAIKELASTAMNQAISDKNFNLLMAGKRGTHSVRKCATTRARRNGCAKDDVDMRARWRKKGRQQDNYADCILPWPDTKCAASLCKGGPVQYTLKHNSGVTEQWIYDYVVPGIRKFFIPMLQLFLVVHCCGVFLKSTKAQLCHCKCCFV
jgi:hypothetical protein